MEKGFRANMRIAAQSLHKPTGRTIGVSFLVQHKEALAGSHLLFVPCLHPLSYPNLGAVVPQRAARAAVTEESEARVLYIAEKYTLHGTVFYSINDGSGRDIYCHFRFSRIS